MPSNDKKGNPKWVTHQDSAQAAERTLSEAKVHMSRRAKWIGMSGSSTRIAYSLPILSSGKRKSNIGERTELDERRLRMYRLPSNRR